MMFPPGGVLIQKNVAMMASPLWGLVGLNPLEHRRVAGGAGQALAERAVDLVERDGVGGRSGEAGRADGATPRVEGLAAADGEQRGSDKSRQNGEPEAPGHHASSYRQASGQTRRRDARRAVACLQLRLV